MLTYPRRSLPLQHLQILKRRIQLTEEDEAILYKGLQGYEGERWFASLLERTLYNEYIVLHDVLLEQNNSHFQMDTLIIHESHIYLLEIKYFQDDYYYEKNQLYNLKSKKRVKNPFYQLQRCEDLFREFLLKHNLHYTIHSHVIFNHPSFTLYQAPIQMNMVLPTQNYRFIQKLNNQRAQITSKENRLVKIIAGKHITKNPFEILPAYHYDDLQKGICCLTCNGMMEQIGRFRTQCKSCHLQESVHSAILRSIVEYNILFPKRRINTFHIHDWTDGTVSLKTIRGVLQKYLDIKGKTKAAHYIFPDKNKE